MSGIPDVSSSNDSSTKGRTRSHVLALVRIACFGIGVGVGIGVVAQAVYLYTHRPKPWNATAVTAKPIRAYVGRDITFSVQYRVRDNTDRDLRLQLRGINAAGTSEWHVFERTFAA
jgi:uncharacterized membrane protein